MQRIILVCAAFMFLVTPLCAQQAPPGQLIPEQSVPPSQSPPESQPESDLPPPFVPPPAARVYDYHRPAARHHTNAHHYGSAHHRGTRHARARRHATHGHHRAVHPSKRTIRRCHSMTYSQIMRHDSCRALMRQELKASEGGHRHVSHHRHSGHHHRSNHHRRR